MLYLSKSILRIFNISTACGQWQDKLTIMDVRENLKCLLGSTVNRDYSVKKQTLPVSRPSFVHVTAQRLSFLADSVYLQKIHDH